jgi:hypothetical protein
MPAGQCPPSPPCFTNGGVLGCRADTFARVLRTAAALAIERAKVPASTPADLANKATSIAELAGTQQNASVDAAITTATSDASPKSPLDERIAGLTRSIADVALTFLVGHELYHLRNGTCRAPIGEALHDRVRYLTKLDASAELFCKGDLDIGEIQADECGFAEVARSPKASLEERDAAYAARAGGALATWSILRNFQTVNPGMIPTPPPIGYLRGPLRALILAASAAPQEDVGRACGESAKLIVTAIQMETQRCESTGRPWGGNVPDPLLALLPPRVEQAWAGNAWPSNTFDCP